MSLDKQTWIIGQKPVDIFYFSESKFLTHEIRKDR